jgi:hypothetical protein
MFRQHAYLAYLGWFEINYSIGWIVSFGAYSFGKRTIMTSSDGSQWHTFLTLSQMCLLAGYLAIRLVIFECGILLERIHLGSEQL